MNQFPQSHLDHAKERVTASPGDAVAYRGAIHTVIESVTRWEYGEMGEPEKSSIAYKLGEDLLRVPAAEVTLIACDPNGPPTVGDQMKAPVSLRHRAPVEPGKAGTVVSADANRLVILFDHGDGAGFDTSNPDLEITRRATPDDAVDAMTRAATWNRAAREEQDYPRTRPAGYFRLKASFHQRDQVKALGALWAPRFKCWYALPAARMSIYHEAKIAYQIQGTSSYMDGE